MIDHVGLVLSQTVLGGIGIFRERGRWHEPIRRMQINADRLCPTISDRHALQVPKLSVLTIHFRRFKKVDDHVAAPAIISDFSQLISERTPPSGVVQVQAHALFLVFGNFSGKSISKPHVSLFLG